MQSSRHLILSILLMVLILLFGTVGYMLLEGWRMIDALYMTIITLTTVGYTEINPLSEEGRMFTILLITLGVGFFLYVAGAVVQFMVEGQIRILFGRKRLDRHIGQLKDHYIVCGYGRIGRVLARKLVQKPVDLVVIEKDRDLVPKMESDRVLYVSGSATEEMNLIKAGIHKAKGLVAVLATDTDNVFLVLTARQLNPDLFIMGRATQEESKITLEAAGASKVESPYDIGAASMAQRIIRPTVTSFLDLAFAYRRTEIQMEEIPVGPKSDLADVLLKDSGIRQKYNLIIIAIKQANGEMIFNPSFETVLRSGDTVIAVGNRDSLAELETCLNPNVS